MEAIDDPDRLAQLESVIASKPGLRQFYRDTYSRFVDCAMRSLVDGRVVELGSGGGFLKEFFPAVMTTDVIPYESVDCVVDATDMPFNSESVSTFLMLNVFHHIPNVVAFLGEVERTLVPGGRVLIVDQYPGVVSRWILKFIHHEAFDERTERWDFPSDGPLSGANGALPWIVFERDLDRFQREFVSLQVERYEPHTPFWYWLAGGLKSWSLLPPRLFRAARTLDDGLIRMSPRWASFVDIELVKTG